MNKPMIPLLMPASKLRLPCCTPCICHVLDKARPRSNTLTIFVKFKPKVKPNSFTHIEDM